MNSKRRMTFAPVIAGAFALIMCSSLLFRPIWFDEALTLMEFMSLPAPSIYTAYDVPNNHILFTLLLKLWASFQNLFCPVPDFSFRIPSMICAALASAMLWRLSAKGSGSFAASMCTALLAASGTFALFGTAVRGYMLGLLLCLTAFAAAKLWIRSGRMLHATIYLVTCVMAAGDVPSNLVAVEAIALLMAPDAMRSRTMAARVAWLAAAPPIGLLTFYLPIAAKFINSMTLGEGWPSGIDAAWNLYASFMMAFLPVMPFSLLGAWTMFHEIPRLRMKMAASICVFILPLPFMLIHNPAPFPRVFFPIWGIWAILLAYPLGKLLKRRRRLAVPAMLLSLAWLPVSFNFKERIASSIFTHGDDLLSPPYISESFKPWKVAGLMKSAIDENPSAKAFVSFDADPYSTIFYGKLIAVPEKAWLFDSPRNGSAQVQDTAPRPIIVCTRKDGIETLSKRFKLTTCNKVLDAGAQQVYAPFQTQNSESHP